jgi:hypothetical protein
LLLALTVTIAVILGWPEKRVEWASARWRLIYASKRDTILIDTSGFTPNAIDSLWQRRPELFDSTRVWPSMWVSIASADMRTIDVHWSRTVISERRALEVFDCRGRRSVVLMDVYLGPDLARGHTRNSDTAGGMLPVTRGSLDEVILDTVCRYALHPPHEQLRIPFRHELLKTSSSP